MSASPAQLKALRKYEENNIDILRGRLPKGTKQKIIDLGYSVNAFVVEAVTEKLEKMEKDGN